MKKFMTTTMILLFISACGKVPSSNSPALDIFSDQGLQANGLMLAAMVDDNFATGAMAMAPLAKLDNFVEGIHPTSNSDFYVRCNRDSLFRIESFNQDRISIFDRFRPSSILAQYLTKPLSDATSSVPVDLIFGADQLGLVLRYSRNEALIVKITRDLFQEMGKFKMNGQADSDGLSEMKSGFYWQDNWFVTHQRLNRNTPDAWGINNIPSLYIFEHQPFGANPIVMNLKIKNPVADIVRHGHTLFIAGAGDLVRMRATEGGIEVIQKDINTRSFRSVAVWLSGKMITDVAVLNDQALLALEYTGSNLSILHALDMATGEKIALPNDLKAHETSNSGHISLIKRDHHQQIWLGYFAGDKKGFYVFDDTGGFKKKIATKLNPVRLTFCQ